MCLEIACGCAEAFFVVFFSIAINVFANTMKGVAEIEFCDISRKCLILSFLFFYKDFLLTRK